MDYEKAYKDALERARQVHTTNIDENKKASEYIFPELRESEDERIRKWIKKELESKYVVDNIVNNAMADKAFAWLEKQGEEKPIERDTETHDLWVYIREWNEKFGRLPKDEDELAACIDYVMKRQKPIDKVESKFKVGDWILIDRPCRIELIDDNGDYVIQYYDSGTKSVFSKKFCETHFHLWNIEDAKDGDVLASNKSIFIFREEYIGEKPTAYCGLMNGLFIEVNGACWTNEKCYPATKEQYNILFQKMEEAGYEWDTEKKELKKIEIEQKPAEWSEEDELILNDFISSLKYNHENAYNKQISWLKSLKDRILPQPKQKWSEEDEKIINDAIWLIEHYATDGHKKLLREQTIDKLKSLKPQNHWKPSDLQLEALESAYKQLPNIRYFLQSLYNGIKSL